MRLLVTGGAGFIGSNFIHLQRRLHPEDDIVVLDALTYAGRRENLDGAEVEFVHGDIRDGALVERALQGVDAVAHFAAESHVDKSISGPVVFADTNMVGTTVLLASSVLAGVSRFLHVSTDEVYGDLGPTDAAFTESTPLSPRSPYSASKAGSDHLALAWHRTYDFPAIVTRCSNNYGPRQHSEKFLPTAIRAALSGESVPLYGDGSNVRDWIHVDDHCRAIDLVLRRGTPGAVYNIGGGCELSNLELAKLVLRFVGREESAIRFVTDRPGHDRRYAVNSDKIQRELGWSPQVAFDDGLREVLEWYRVRL